MKTGDTWERLNGAITITKRADDYHAMLADDPVFWENGGTEAEAIGALIITHGSHLEFSSMVDNATLEEMHDKLTTALEYVVGQTMATHYISEVRATLREILGFPQETTHEPR